MAGRSAFGGLVEGIQGGIEARDTMDKNREIKEYMRQRNTQGAIDLQENYDMRATQWGAEGGDPNEFSAQNTRYETAQDPALLRFGKWLGNRIGFGQKGQQEQAAVQSASLVSPEIQPAGPQASGATTYGMPERYADGGRIKDTLNDVFGIPMARAGVPTSRGGSDEPGIMSRAFDDTIAGVRSGNDDYAAATKRQMEADTAHEMGSALGDRTVAAVKGGWEGAKGLAKDVLVDNPVTQFVGGALGFDGGIPAPQEDALAPQGPTATDTTAATEATVDVPERSNEQVAQQAISDAEVQAIENLDYKLLVDQQVSPDELPSMTTQDWGSYRREMMDSMLAKGMSPKDALEQVDYMTVGTQMRGFQREGQKAMLYLQTGQSREAAMALRQAYQYFPNGVGVKFGVANDPKTGQPSIIAMGIDEQTGEPTGKPMLITTERLNVMMENMTNPQAFRAWTKDGRDLQMEIAKLEETGTHNRSMEDIYRAGAITDRMEAQDAATGGGGLKPGDVDRRASEYYDRLMEDELRGNLEENSARSLASAMSLATAHQPNLNPNTVYSNVLDAFEAKGELGVYEYLESLRGE